MTVLIVLCAWHRRPRRLLRVRLLRGPAWRVRLLVSHGICHACRARMLR